MEVDAEAARLTCAVCLELLADARRWTQIAAPDGKVSVTISLDPNDMERLLQAVKGAGLGAWNGQMQPSVKGA